MKRQRQPKSKDQVEVLREEIAAMRCDPQCQIAMLIEIVAGQAREGERLRREIARLRGKVGIVDDRTRPIGDFEYWQRYFDR